MWKKIQLQLSKSGGILGSKNIKVIHGISAKMSFFFKWKKIQPELSKSGGILGSKNIPQVP